MGNIKSIINRESLLEYFRKYPPVSESDFCLEIITTSDHTSDSEVRQLIPITGIEIPQLGISFNQSNMNLSYQEPNINASSIGVSFVVRVDDVKSGASSIHKLVRDQYNETGTLKFTPVSRRPDVMISLRTGEHSIVHILLATGCMFSEPTFQVNLSGTEASVFKTIITYNNLIKKI